MDGLTGRQLCQCATVHTGTMVERVAFWNAIITNRLCGSCPEVAGMVCRPIRLGI
jgi:hypothetical protein